MRYSAMTDALLEDFCVAIVLQAARDYRHPRKVRKKRKNIFVWGPEEVLKFFHSDWYRMLCNIDPEYIIAKLQEEKAGGSRYEN